MWEGDQLGDVRRISYRALHREVCRAANALASLGVSKGTAEFESALAAAPGVAEVAVVGYPHPRKGQGVCAFVVADRGASIESAALDAAVRRIIGAHAKVDVLRVVPALPKTRSGKVMRRILRKLAEGTTDDLGDLSTLSDPSLGDALRAACA